MFIQEIKQPIVVGFNGPPKSGKDTIAKLLQLRLSSEASRFILIDHLARPMREMAMALLGLKGWDQYTDYKDVPNPLLTRKQDESIKLETMRELMIAISEEFIKPRYGRDFWARAMWPSHKAYHDYPNFILLVPDIGFKEEVLFLMNQADYRQVNLYREDCDFSNDSRDYVEIAQRILPLANHIEGDEALATLVDHIVDWLDLPNF